MISHVVAGVVSSVSVADVYVEVTVPPEPVAPEAGEKVPHVSSLGVPVGVVAEKYTASLGTSPLEFVTRSCETLRSPVRGCWSGRRDGDGRRRNRRIRLLSDYCRARLTTIAFAGSNNAEAGCVRRCVRRGHGAVGRSRSLRRVAERSTRVATRGAEGDRVVVSCTRRAGRHRCGQRISRPIGFNRRGRRCQRHRVLRRRLIHDGGPSLSIISIRRSDSAIRCGAPRYVSGRCVGGCRHAAGIGSYRRGRERTAGKTTR